MLNPKLEIPSQVKVCASRTRKFLVSGLWEESSKCQCKSSMTLLSLLSIHFPSSCFFPIQLPSVPHISLYNFTTVFSCMPLGISECSDCTLPPFRPPSFLGQKHHQESALQICVKGLVLRIRIITNTRTSTLLYFTSFFKFWPA